MAAAVLESIAAPCARFIPGVASTPRRDQAARLLPECRGLRVARPVRVAASVLRGVSPPVLRWAAVVCEVQGTAVDVPDVTKDSWRSLVLQSDKPVLVEFWAPWCGPCGMVLPTVAKLSKTYKGKIKCLKLNTDESPEIATQYGIRSIPTIMIFKNGEKKDAVIGAVPESTLIASIEKFL